MACDQNVQFSNNDGFEDGTRPGSVDNSGNIFEEHVRGG